MNVFYSDASDYKKERTSSVKSQASIDMPDEDDFSESEEDSHY
jgi:hypothetical protein